MVVTEGTEIPPGSLVVGLPAKVRRPLSTEEIAFNQAAALHYVENARAFRAAGRLSPATSRTLRQSRSPWHSSRSHLLRPRPCRRPARSRR